MSIDQDAAGSGDGLTSGVDPERLAWAGPQLRPGETPHYLTWVSLDQLLPLYFHREWFRRRIVWLPVRFLWDLLCMIVSALLRSEESSLAGLVRVLVPPYRPYGLFPRRRLYRAIRRPFHGGSWSGGKDNIAWQFWTAVRTTPLKHNLLEEAHDPFFLVLTDQRLLVLSWEYTYHIDHDRMTTLFELPRGTFGVRHEAPGYWFGHRFDLKFADGSWIALEAGSEQKRQGILDALG